METTEWCLNLSGTSTQPWMKLRGALDTFIQCSFKCDYYLMLPSGIRRWRCWLQQGKGSSSLMDWISKTWFRQTRQRRRGYSCWTFCSYLQEFSHFELSQLQHWMVSEHSVSCDLRGFQHHGCALLHWERLSRNFPQFPKQLFCVLVLGPSKINGLLVLFWQIPTFPSLIISELKELLLKGGNYFKTLNSIGIFVFSAVFFRHMLRIYN